MISPGKFQTSINDSVTFLNNFDLLKAKNTKSTSVDYSSFINFARKNSLSAIHNYIIEKNTFDILLKDDSIFLFSMDNNTIRYSYIQNPYNWASKEDYVLSILRDYDEFENGEILEAILGAVKEEEYEQFIHEQGLNSKSNHFRYDYSESGYEPLTHSCSHLHIGLNENLRIPISQMITPLLFVIFCIKHTYYQLWKGKINSADPYLTSKLSNIKASEAFDLVNWNQDEENELYIR